MLFSLLHVKHNPLCTSKDLALSGLILQQTHRRKNKCLMLFSLLHVKHTPLCTSKDLALSELNISTWNYTNANLTENSGLLSFQFF